MAFKYCMPKFGLTMEEGTITKWFKSVGDKVVAGEPFVEIETDKITNVVEVPESGTLLYLAAIEGDTIPIMEILAIIGEEGETINLDNVSNNTLNINDLEQNTNTENTYNKEVSNNAILPSSKSGFSSPFARKLAKEAGVNIEDVEGTGPNNRVIERDIKKYSISPLAKKIADDNNVSEATLSSMNTNERIMKNDVEELISKSSSSSLLDSKVTKASSMRKTIAERMLLSWHTYPHVTISLDVDMTKSKKIKSELEESASQKISFTEIIVKSTAQALVDYPIVNSTFKDNEIYEHSSVNIGVAVSVVNGLLVPVIRDSQNKSVRQLSEEIKRLVSLARDNKLSSKDMSGGTFTISNLGKQGVDFFTPIINYPESAILGVATCMDKAVVIDSSIVIRPILKLCLSFDHRLIDGALAGDFLGKIKQYLENPLLLF